MWEASLSEGALFPIEDKDSKAGSNWSAMSQFKNRFETKSMKVIDSGYADCNSEKWRYVL